MLKKSLIALAVAGSTSAMAATVDVPASEVYYSNQGAVAVDTMTAGELATTGGFTITLGAEYAIGDIITLTFTGGEFDSAAVLPTSVTSTGGTANVTLGLLSSTDSSLTYRVTEVATADTTIGEVFTFSSAATPATGITFDADTVLASGGVTLTYAAETSTGVTIDAGSGNTATVFQGVDQFSATTTALFNGVVDVEEQRTLFETQTAPDSTTVDSATITLASATTFAPAGTGPLTPETINLQATLVDYDLVLNGSFDHLDTDADVDGVDTTAVTATSGVVDVESDKVTLDGVADGALTVTIDTAETGSAEIIPTVDYTYDVTVNYSAGGNESMELVSGVSAGAWTLNGSVVTVPYMPFGPNTKVILRHTNTGAQTGEVSVRYMLEGVTTNWVDLGVLGSTSRGLQDIRDTVIDAIMADAGVESGKVAIEITSNVPSADVTVYAGYKVTTDADRGFVGTFGALGASQD